MTRPRLAPDQVARVIEILTTAGTTSSPDEIGDRLSAPFASCEVRFACDGRALAFIMIGWDREVGVSMDLRYNQWISVKEAEEAAVIFGRVVEAAKAIERVLSIVADVGTVEGTP